MPGDADFIQRTLHAVEQGWAAVWVKRILCAVVILFIAIFYLAHEFSGLATSQAMDQAQIARKCEWPGLADQLIRPRASANSRART